MLVRQGGRLQSWQPQAPTAPTGGPGRFGARPRWQGQPPQMPRYSPGPALPQGMGPMAGAGGYQPRPPMVVDERMLGWVRDPKIRRWLVALFGKQGRKRDGT